MAKYTNNTGDTSIGLVPYVTRAHYLLIVPKAIGNFNVQLECIRVKMYQRETECFQLLSSNIQTPLPLIHRHISHTNKSIKFSTTHVDEVENEKICEQGTWE